MLWRQCVTCCRTLCQCEAALEIKCVPVTRGARPTHTVTGKILLAAVMVMQVLNTTCSQCPCSTQSSEFQDKGSVNVMFISSWASRPKKQETEQHQSQAVESPSHSVVGLFTGERCTLTKDSNLYFNILTFHAMRIMSWNSWDQTTTSCRLLLAPGVITVWTAGRNDVTLGYSSESAWFCNIYQTVRGLADYQSDWVDSWVYVQRERGSRACHYQ